MKVVKFGGSSLADAEHFQKVKGIIQGDPSRAYIVPSAPGKRYLQDEKVTDLLYLCQRKAEKREDFTSALFTVQRRYEEIAIQLALKFDFAPYFEEIEKKLKKDPGQRDYAASRGEYLNGLLLAAYLNKPFIDAAKVICFDQNGKFNSEKTHERLSETLKNHPSAVIPGFYGADEEGNIFTFSRGGSDITGAIVARAAGAQVYENWTDVSGFLMADPKVVDAPKEIGQITYQELRELSYMGASVLHEEAIFPVHQAGIPTNIRNTNRPEHPGTWIEYAFRKKETTPAITGLAGKRGFSIIAIEKAMMNVELGFGRRVLEELEKNHISFDHVTTGIDTMCVVVEKRHLEGKQRQVIQNILTITGADSVTVKDDMALVATVGWGMVNNFGTAAKLFGAIGDAKINVKMIDQGSSELSIIIAVEEEEMVPAINAIYQAFV
ncbi:MAG: aspartate kinase [Clostridiales bacterium]|nr:aspartate kinase [Clostridiales bacterium]